MNEVYNLYDKEQEMQAYKRTLESLLSQEANYNKQLNNENEREQ